jgi:hypothetical protein
MKAVMTPNNLEASFVRVAKATKGKALMLILGSLLNRGSAENSERLAKLKEAVRKEGFGFIQTEARAEHDGSSIAEQAVLVLAPAAQARRLWVFTQQLAPQFDQRVYIFKSPDGTVEFVDMGRSGRDIGGESALVNPWDPRRIGEFMFMLRLQEPTYDPVKHEGAWFVKKTTFYDRVTKEDAWFVKEPTFFSRRQGELF